MIRRCVRNCTVRLRSSKRGHYIIAEISAHSFPLCVFFFGAILCQWMSRVLCVCRWCAMVLHSPVVCQPNLTDTAGVVSTLSSA